MAGRYLVSYGGKPGAVPLFGLSLLGYAVAGEWWVFAHKLIEDTWERVDIDQGAIVFELRKPGEQALGQGKLEIPLRKPSVFAGPQAGAGNEVERAGDDPRLPPGLAAEQVAARAWSPSDESSPPITGTGMESWLSS